MINTAYTIQGEVISVTPKRESDQNVTYYTVEATLDNGTKVDIPNCYVASMYGGIGDYQRRRVRVRNDSEFPEYSYAKSDLDASVGERVLISFVNGSIYHPVIIGFVDHPNSVIEMEEPDLEDPNLINQYQGLRETVDEKGQWRITRKGAPEVIFKPKSNGLTSVSVGGDESFAGDSSEALEPKDTTERFIIEVLDKALFRVRDPEGAMIEIDHVTKKGVYISDNDFKSIDDINEVTPEGALQDDFKTTKAEYIHLKREDQSLTIASRLLTNIYSLKDRYDFTQENYKHEIQKNCEIIITENYKDSITGDYESFVEKNRGINTNGNFNIFTKGNNSQKIEGTNTIEVVGDFKIKTDSTLTLYSAKDYDLKTDSNFIINAASDIKLTASGGAALNLSSGKVALGGPTAELLDLFDQTLQKFDATLTQIQALTVLGNLGFPTSPPINAAAFATTQVEVATIKATLGTIKGSL